MTMVAAKSKSLPFMPQPAALDGSLSGELEYQYCTSSAQQRPPVQASVFELGHMYATMA